MARIRKRTIKKKAVDRPEEFLGLYHKAVEYISGKKRSLLLISGALLILILATAAILFLNFYNNNKASLLYYEGSRYYEIDNPYIKLQIHQEERYEKALDIFQRIVSKYPRTKKAPMALYSEGNCYFGLKNYDEAEKAYRLFIERYPKEKEILPLVYQKLAYLYEIKGESEKALNAFTAVTSFDAGLKDLSYIEMGRIHESEGKQEDALKNYRMVVDNFSASPWFQEAKRRAESLKK